MRFHAILMLSALALARAHGQTAAPPVPDPRQLMRDVIGHQKDLDKVRENYTYTSTQISQDVDASGKVTKTETTESDCFFVNGHAIERVVRKNGQPLNDHDDRKETERVTKLVEKAEKTPRDKPLEGPVISLGVLLEILDVRSPRREMFHNRPTIVFDFIGRKDAKTHGIAEEATKKIKGTVWVDEADHEVAHLEVTFYDNLHIAGGLLANIQRGSNFTFDQAPVDRALWLPTGLEANMQARVLLFKNMRQHFSERDYDYKRFSVETQQSKDAKVTTQKR